MGTPFGLVPCATGTLWAIVPDRTIPYWFGAIDLESQGNLVSAYVHTFIIFKCYEPHYNPSYHLRLPSLYLVQVAWV